MTIVITPKNQVICTRMSVKPYCFIYIAIFEKATVEFSKSEIKIHRTGKESEIIPMTGPNHYFREIACFAKNVIEDAPFDICSVESTLNSIKIAMAEERSARRNGKRISLKKS